MLRIYVSHSIRGKFGKDATPEQMKANCDKAILFGELLRLNTRGTNFYIPADHDEVIALAYQKGYLTDTQILELDCVILEDCVGLLVYAPDEHISLGMQIEIDYANAHKIPVHYTDGKNWGLIQEFIWDLEGSEIYSDE